MSVLRKVSFGIAALLLVAGAVFLAFPIAAIPDETLLGIGAAVAAIVWVFQEVRAMFGERRLSREHESAARRYEEYLNALATGGPEQVRQVLRLLQDQTRRAIAEYLKTMHWNDFERLVGTVLEKLGFRNVVVTQSTHDHGVDVRASYDAGIAPVDFCVQVKRTDTVGAPDVQKLRGACTKNEHAILVTSGRFTDDAQREAQQLPRVTLISGAQLADLMMDHGIGVRREDAALHHPALDSLPYRAQTAGVPLEAPVPPEPVVPAPVGPAQSDGVTS